VTQEQANERAREITLPCVFELNADLSRERMNKAIAGALLRSFEQGVVTEREAAKVA